MKKTIALLCTLLCCVFSILAQAPEKFTYQAVVRNTNNQLLPNTQVGVQVVILQGSAQGSIVYGERHTESTNANGLVTLIIGEGNIIAGHFSNINWGNGVFFISVGIDPAGGTDYSIWSTQQLLSVPYALYANEAGNGFSGDYHDLTNTPTIPTIPTNVSAFTNDAGYITMDSIPEIPNVPNDVSAFNNDAGYITMDSIPPIPSVPTNVCHQPISIIYPIGEALCGLLGVLALFSAAAMSAGSVSLELFRAPVVEPAVWAYALSMFWLLLGAYPVCAVDCKYKLIPDSISVGGIVAGLLISIIPGGVTPFQSLLGAVVAGGGLYLMGWTATKLLKKDAMGFGDVKLLAGYGALMGVTGAVETLIVAALLGIIVMVPYGKLRKSDDGSGQIPFGPFLAVAAPLMYLWGEQLFNLYVTFVFGE